MTRTREQTDFLKDFLQILQLGHSSQPSLRRIRDAEQQLSSLIKISTTLKTVETKQNISTPIDPSAPKYHLLLIESFHHAPLVLRCLLGTPRLHRSPRPPSQGASPQTCSHKRMYHHGKRNSRHRRRASRRYGRRV